MGDDKNILKVEVKTCLIHGTKLASYFRFF